MTTFPAALTHREAARRRWQISLFSLAGVGAIGALVAVVVEFTDLPNGLVWGALWALVLGVVGVFVCALGMGWTAGLRWYQSLWWALKMACAAIRELF